MLDWRPPDWHFVLASPRDLPEEVPARECRMKRAEIAAVKNTDWIWTGYDGGPISLYHEAWGRMVEYKKIILQRHF